MTVAKYRSWAWLAGALPRSALCNNRVYGCDVTQLIAVFPLSILRNSRSCHRSHKIVLKCQLTENEKNTVTTEGSTMHRFLPKIFTVGVGTKFAVKSEISPHLKREIFGIFFDLRCTLYIVLGAVYRETHTHIKLLAFFSPH